MSNNDNETNIHYGIELAKHYGLPDDMISYAEEYIKDHDNIFEVIKDDDEDNNEYQLLQRILPLTTSTLDTNGV